MERDIKHPLFKSVYDYIFSIVESTENYIGVLEYEGFDIYYATIAMDDVDGDVIISQHSSPIINGGIIESYRILLDIDEGVIDVNGHFYGYYIKILEDEITDFANKIRLKKIKAIINK